MWRCSLGSMLNCRGLCVNCMKLHSTIKYHSSKFVFSTGNWWISLVKCAMRFHMHQARLRVSSSSRTYVLSFTQTQGVKWKEKTHIIWMGVPLSLKNYSFGLKKVVASTLQSWRFANVCFITTLEMPYVQCYPIKIGSNCLI